ncbi:MAG: hypothetical protein WD851_16720 [Pirellulales bacterium]
MRCLRSGARILGKNLPGGSSAASRAVTAGGPKKGLSGGDSTPNAALPVQRAEGHTDTKGQMINENVAVDNLLGDMLTQPEPPR